MFNGSIHRFCVFIFRMFFSNKSRYITERIIYFFKFLDTVRCRSILEDRPLYDKHISSTSTNVCVII